MTTDRVPKLAAYAFYHGEQHYVVGGIAKGSGMIAPNMATMLAFVATDRADVARSACTPNCVAASDDSFNMISVDGAMSTNDAVYALRPGRRRRAAAGLHGSAARRLPAISRSRWSPTAKARPKRSRST